MKNVLFLVEEFTYERMAVQLAEIVNTLDGIAVTVQVLCGGEKFRHMFAKTICYHAGTGISAANWLMSAASLYHWLVRDCYDICFAWTEGLCVRILSGCPYPNTMLYCVIRSDLSEGTRFAAGFRSWQEAGRCYGVMDGFFTSAACLITPFCSVSGISAGRITVMPPPRTVLGSCLPMLYREYGAPGTLHVCAAGENMSYRQIRRLHRLHEQLLAEGYWHRMVVVAGSRRMAGGRDTFLHLPWDERAGGILAECDIFLCPGNEASMLDALADAVYAGKPAVAVEGTVARGIIDDGGCGIVVENSMAGLTQGMAEMLTQAEKRYRYAKKAKEWHRSYAGKNTVRCMREVLCRAVTEKTEEKENRLTKNPQKYCISDNYMI